MIRALRSFAAKNRVPPFLRIVIAPSFQFQSKNAPQVFERSFWFIKELLMWFKQPQTLIPEQFKLVTLEHHETPIILFLECYEKHHTLFSKRRINFRNQPKQVNNQSELIFWSRDWFSANHGPLFPDSVGS
eukprot:sb/3475034/